MGCTLKLLGPHHMLWEPPELDDGCITTDRETHTNLCFRKGKKYTVPMKLFLVGRMRKATPSPNTGV